VLAWREHDLDDAVGLLWKRVAYATRYGRASLTEVLGLDQSHLERFLRALVDLVNEENESNRPSSFQNRT
jgi:hypothetical protein